jgi:hypothetical protein
MKTYKAICDACGKSFERNRGRVKGQRDFCSRECVTQGQVRPKRELTAETLLNRMTETGISYPSQTLARYYGVGVLPIKALLAGLLSEGKLRRVIIGTSAQYIVPTSVEPTVRYKAPFTVMGPYAEALRADAALKVMGR